MKERRSRSRSRSRSSRWKRGEPEIPRPEEISGETCEHELSRGQKRGGDRLRQRERRRGQRLYDDNGQCPVVRCRVPGMEPEDLTPLQCAVMRKHPITTPLGPREPRNISARIHGNDYARYTLTLAAVRSFDRKEIRRQGVRWHEPRCTRDPVTRVAHPHFYRAEGSLVRRELCTSSDAFISSLYPCPSDSVPFSANFILRFFLIFQLIDQTDLNLFQ